MIKRLIHFIKEGIWLKNEREYRSRFVRWGVRQIKVLILTIRGSGEHNLAITSAALTFYTLMSIVPIAAMIFGIVKGFGVQTSFEEYLYERFPESSEVITQILHFANNLLERTRGGIIAATGFVVLVWAVLRVFGNVEAAFNTIWEVRRSRSMARKLSDYLVIVFVSPILWIISNSISIFIRRQLDSLSGPSAFVDVLYGLLSVVVIWVMFTFIYRVMPNTRVRVRCALSAGIVAGTAFQVFQFVYVYLQSWMTSYNAIYGSLAALPLFLIWMQTSWQILLFGAELSFAFQNISLYEQERQSLHMSYGHRLQVLVAAMLTVTRHFADNKGPITSEEVAHQLGMPIRIVRDVMFDLENAGLLSSVQHPVNEKVNYYIPARDIHNLTLVEVVQSVEQHGGSADFDLSSNTTLKRVGDALAAMRAENERSKSNILLMSIQ